MIDFNTDLHYSGIFLLFAVDVHDALDGVGASVDGEFFGVRVAVCLDGLGDRSQLGLVFFRTICKGITTLKW